MQPSRSYILKSFNISWRMLAWPAFFLCLYFLSVSVYRFINANPGLHAWHVQWHVASWFSLAGLFALCIANWWIESQKWKTLLQLTLPDVSFADAARSVLMGCSVGFITPNRIGDYAGRAISFPVEQRSVVVVLNILSGFTQFAGVSLLGVFSWWLLPAQMNVFPGWAVAITSVTVILLVVITVAFCIRPQRIKNARIITWLGGRYVEPVANMNPIGLRPMLEVMTWSMIRSVIFAVQLMLLLEILSPGISWLNAFLASSIYFFVLTVSPSLVLNKLGLREALSVFILVPVTGSPIVAAASVFLLWLINQVVPVILGSLLLVKKSVQ